jgi:GR25 family glycosyltransferase involved in LPS biosynthesis
MFKKTNFFKNIPKQKSLLENILVSKNDNCSNIEKSKTTLENYIVEKICVVNDVQNVEFINQKISNIYVINLNTNNIRKIYIEIIMKKMNINFNLIRVNKVNNSPYNMRNCEYGCYLSHLWCLNDAINNNYDEIIIFEDDIVFHKNFKQLFYNIFSNSNYDFVLLGAYDKFLSTINYKNIQNNMYYPTTKFILGSHAIYYSKKGIEYTLTYKKNNPILEYDVDLINIFTNFNKTSAICYPNLIVVELSTTNLNHNYGFLNANNEKQYYNKSQINFNFNDYYFIYLCFFIKKKKIQFNDNITFENYIDLILDNYYKDDLIRNNEIKNRIDFSFFTNEDLKMFLLSE